MNTKSGSRGPSPRERDRQRKQHLKRNGTPSRFTFSSLEDTPPGIQLRRFEEGFEMALSRFSWVPAVIWLLGTLGTLFLCVYSFQSDSETIPGSFKVFTVLAFGGAFYLLLRSTLRRTWIRLQQGKLRVVTGLFGIGGKQEIPVKSIRRFAKRFKKVGYSEYTPVAAGIIAPEDTGMNADTKLCELVIYGSEEVWIPAIVGEQKADFVQFAIKEYLKGIPSQKH